MKEKTGGQRKCHKTWQAVRITRARSS